MMQIRLVKFKAYQYLLLSLALIIFPVFFAGCGGSSGGSSSSSVTVPAVEDLTQTDAETALSSEGLTLGDITLSCDDTISAGNIISSSPEEGSSVARGSSVDIVVSLGSGPCFNLSDPSKFTVGYEKTAALTGSDSSNFDYTGTYSIETQSATSIGGQDVIPVITGLAFSTDNPNIADFDSEETAYFVDEDTPYSIESGTVTYTPDAGAISELPSIGVIGGNGTLTSWTGDDGSTFSGTWVVEDGGSGLADVVESYIFRDASGDITSTQEIITTVNEFGIPQSIYIVLDYPAPLDITITLEGDLS